MVRTGLVAAALLVATVAWADETQDLYDQKCKLCHSIKGEGGKKADVGGPLDGVGAKRDKEWLLAYMTDPKSKVPDAKMPKIKLSPEQWKAMVDLMASLQ